LAGFPKCGTTSLEKSLSNTGLFNTTNPKETFHFGGDFSGISSHIGSESKEEYLSHYYEDPLITTKINLDATTGVIYSSSALEHIRDAVKDPKFIVLVRNPYKYIEAWHNELIYSFNEDELDIHRAINLTQQRRVGRNIPHTCKSKIFLDYYKVTSIGSSIREVERMFGKSNLLILKTDELGCEDIISEKVGGFLDLKVRLTIPRLNERKKHRFNSVSRLIYNPPIFSKNVYALRKFFVKNRFPLVEKIKRKLIVSNNDKLEMRWCELSEYDSFLKKEIELFEEVINERVMWGKE